MKNIIILIFYCTFGLLSSNLHAFDFGKLFESDQNTSNKVPDFSKLEEKTVKKHKSGLSDIPYEKLKEEKERLLIKNKKHEATKYLERMVALCTDHKESCLLLLELADLYFDLKDFTKAEKTYNEFALLYPGNLKLEYVKYRAIFCASELTLDAEHDQTKTQETVRLANEFLKKRDFSTYKSEVEKILTSCQEKLLESEANIFSFYLKRESYTSAHTRLENIMKEYTPHLPTHEPRMLEMQYQLALAESNFEQTIRTQWELTQRFPQHPITLAIASDVPYLTTQIALLDKPTEDAKLSSKPVALAQTTPIKSPKELINRS